MSVEIEWPVEFVVPGTPISFAASANSRHAWQTRIREAVQPLLPQNYFAAQNPVQVTIFFFADTPVRFDIDNIVKPILDALKGCVFIDDRQVERLVVQKFEPERLFTFSDPSGELSDAFEADRPRVYLAIKGSEPGEITP